MLNDEPVPTIPLEQWTADHMARVHEFRIGPDRELCVRLNALNMATGLVLALGTEWLNVAGQRRNAQRPFCAKPTDLPTGCASPPQSRNKELPCGEE